MKVQSKFFLMSTVAILAIISSASAVDVPGLSRAKFLWSSIHRKDAKLDKTNEQLVIEESFDERSDGYSRRKTKKALKTGSQLRVLCRELKDVIESNENGDLDEWALKDECGDIQPYSDRVVEPKVVEPAIEPLPPTNNNDEEMTTYVDTDGFRYSISVRELREIEERRNQPNDMDINVGGSGNQGKGTGNQGTGNQGKGTGNQGNGDQRNNPGPDKKVINKGDQRNNAGPDKTKKPNDGDQRNNAGPDKTKKPNDGDQRNNGGPDKKPGTGNQGKGTGNQGKGTGNQGNGDQRNNAGPDKTTNFRRLERVTIEPIVIERPVFKVSTIDISKLNLPTLQLKPPVIKQEMVRIEFTAKGKKKVVSKKSGRLEISDEDGNVIYQDSNKQKRKQKATKGASTEVVTDNTDLIAGLKTIMESKSESVEDVNNLKSKNFEPLIRKAALIRAAAGLSVSGQF